VHLTVRASLFVAALLGCASPPGPEGRDASPEHDAASADAPTDDGPVVDAFELPECRGERVELFRDKDWYMTSTEPVLDTIGTFHHIPTAASPGGRDYQFFLDDLPFYHGALVNEERLIPLDGRRVLATGKTVDIGYGPELWSESICGID
jgi:hypothetical protein